MILGFSGTKNGMTPAQRKAVRSLIHNATRLHLGDCVGADDQAYEEATSFGIAVEGHPPTKGQLRCFRTYDKTWPEKPYLDRNQDIAEAGVDGLIAAPRGFEEQRRSGTWSTVRRARKLGRRIWIVRPDGSVVVEVAKQSPILGVVHG